MIAITGRKAGDCTGGFAGARDGRSCNLSGRNHLLDVRVIIVIRDISRRATVEIWTLGLFRAGAPRPNHPGSDTFRFQTSRYILHSRSNPNLAFDATVWAYRGFYVPGICEFPDVSSDS